MELKYEVDGEDRKLLAKAISRFTGEEMRFMVVPNFDYVVGSVRIDRKGTVKIDISEDLNIKELVKFLKAEGFKLDPRKATMCITVPVEKLNGIDAEINFLAIINSKRELIRQALKIPFVDVKDYGNSIELPWFHEYMPLEELRVYQKFVDAMVDMANESNLVVHLRPCNKKYPNPKYSFSRFLTRLGFIGREHKKTREILLRYLNSSSAHSRPKSQESQEGVNE